MLKEEAVRLHYRKKTLDKLIATYSATPQSKQQRKKHRGPPDEQLSLPGEE
jgi:hypothetical protein